MRNLKNYKLFSLILVLAYVLSACSGVPGSDGANVNDSDPVVTFAGVVESMGAGQWTISGQVVNVSGTTSVDANIAVGDTVKVEAVIDQGGVPTAVKIEFSGADNVNSNDDNGNDDNANDDNSNGDNSNDDNANDDNTNGNTNGNDNSSDDIEVIGILEALTSTSLTIDGVEYQIDSFTEFKGEIVVGDQVKAHVIVNTDGTLTVREIERFSGDDNGNDDNSNDDNGNDDNGNDDNGNDDNGNDDDSNDDNSNDDDSNDDNSNG